MRIKIVLSALVLFMAATANAAIIDSTDFAIIVDSGSDVTEPSESQSMKRAWQHQAFNKFAVDATADTIGGIHVNDITKVTMEWSITRVGESTFLPYVWALDNGVTTAANTTFATPPTAITEDNWSASLTGETWDNVTTGQIYNSTSRTGDIFPDPLSPVTRLARENFGNISSAVPYNVSIELDLTAFKNLITSDTGNSITLIFSQQDSGASGFSYAVPTNTNPDWLSPRLNITAIPEPSSFALLGMALAGTLAFRRRKG